MKAKMERERIEEVVMKVLEAVLRCEFAPGAAVSRENTPGWDSLKHLEVVFALEDELGIEFTEDSIADLDSAAKLVQAALDRHAP